MWPIRMDMSWDECRQCLRCLELDAYGNMVSVLRAQGPFTEDKKKLLEELARVLHITNERHRAEVRRAVNDEKLSLIAEQLNGPNTWADWAIEGRRTIPLLPRLKSHTAFTGLANSLSLVIAAANEKKIPINDQPQQQKESIEVKADASTLCDKSTEERPLKFSISNCQGNVRGRNRKRPLPDGGDVGRCVKQNIKQKLHNDTDINSVNIDKQELPLPLSINLVNDTEHMLSTDKSRCFDKSLTRNLVTCTVSPIERTNWDDCINSTNSIACHNDTISQAKITAINVNSNNLVQLDLEKRLTREINKSDDIDSQKNTNKNTFEFDHVTNDNSNTLTCENTQLSPLEIDGISNPTLSQPSSPTDLMNITETVTINSDSTSSSGPGPPQINIPILMHNKLPPKMVNQHKKSEMNLTFNSNKIIKINDLPTVRLDTKGTNVIVVHKGPASNVKLSYGGKKILGKIISNNSDKIVNIMPTLNSSHADDINVKKTNSNVDNMVVLDIRQDDSEEKNSHSINNEVAIDIFNCENKTVLSNMDHSLVEYSSEDCSAILAHHVDVIHTENNITNDDNYEDSSDLNLNENVEIVSTLDVPEQSGSEEIFINSESHIIMDGQTEVYNFQSPEGNVCEIQIEETPTEEFKTELVTTDVNVTDFNYMVDDEETVSIPEDERGQYELFHDFSDS